MTDARTIPPEPSNEPTRSYPPGSEHKSSLKARLDELRTETVNAPAVIAGRDIETGNTVELRAPHDRSLHLADVHTVGERELTKAIEAAQYAKPDWTAMDWEDRAAIFLRAAELLATTWRDTVNGSTMLGQSKTVYQAEIDAACELIDFLRFNVWFAAQIYSEQPDNALGVWNRVDYRPLEGFVLAITPFNFTSITGNLPTAPALMGNTVLWKPSEKSAYSAHFLMRLLQEAGLPDGVINLVQGSGQLAADVCTDHPGFAGLHFTGSVVVLRDLFELIGSRTRRYRTFPRIVGESGGKNFVLAHPSADPASLVTALTRGAFEYQGQKCSAVSRAYLPSNLWAEVRDEIVDVTRSLQMGDVYDFRNFMGAVIDRNAFEKHRGAIEEARQHADVGILAGGGSDDSDGWFIEPTILTTTDPHYRTMEEELFGPILTVFVYDESEWERAIDLVDSTSPYGLTGSVFATDRGAIVESAERLRQAAGNFYINDKPTGAVVGQQPFGGARASGTNDKAGSRLNLLRWISPRSIKENLHPPTDHTYPHMADQ
ncbi:MAG: L-glutamate gamma-semialdehyde dehydrogenase [Actinobacteria bacterium]|nr:L-glutamate gamma-semialdehyde dehydrogenase [Actinomycetota bacterium]